MDGMPALKKFWETKQGDDVGKIILHPSHPDYCRECMYYTERPETCTSQKYEVNIYQVICVWHFCPYKRKKEIEDADKNRTKKAD